MARGKGSIEKMKPQWFQILLALADRERHGSGIRKDVLENTDGQIKLWPAMLYGSLKQLADQGLIEESEREDVEADGDRRRFYRITPAGRTALAGELDRLAKYLRVAEAKHALRDGAR